MDKNTLKEELEKLSKNSSVEDLQKYIKNMIEVRGFKNTLLQRMCLLTEEIGELAKEVRKTDNNLRMVSRIITFEQKGKYSKEKHQNLSVRVKVIA